MIKNNYQKILIIIRKIQKTLLRPSGYAIIYSGNPMGDSRSAFPNYEPEGMMIV